MEILIILGVLLVSGILLYILFKQDVQIVILDAPVYYIDEFEVSYQYKIGESEDGVLTEYCVKGWDYVNKCNVRTVSYRNYEAVIGSFVKYSHLKDVYTNVEIVAYDSI